MAPFCWSAEPDVVLDANSVVSSASTFAVTLPGADAGQVVSLRRAGSSFFLADLPAPFVSQASSSLGAGFFKAPMGCFMLDLIVALLALTKGLRFQSFHLR